MRVVFISLKLRSGGAEKALASFANALAALGEDVHIACIRDTESDYAVDERVAVHLLRTSSGVRVPLARQICDALALAAHLRELSGDVLIRFHVPVAYAVRLRLAAWLSGVRLVCAVRNNIGKELLSKSASLRKAKLETAIAYLFADAIWIQAEGQRGFFPRFMHGKIFKVPNILDGRFLDIGRPDRDRISRFVSAGRIHPQKNQKLLVEAFERMIRRTGNRDATLTIYGKALDVGRSHDTAMELEALIHRLRLEDRVFLPGYADDIGAKYAEADAFVFGSDYEGCPNALMEAMAAGLPCISTDCPTGPSEIIEDGKDGILVPVGDVDAMSLAMERLAADPGMACRMGMAARRKMEEWGSEEELGKQLMKILRHVCSRARRIPGGEA